jgi:hypothetical protein
MNVEIGAEAAQFPGKEYINGIAVAVYKITRKVVLKITQKSIRFLFFQNLGAAEGKVP